MPRPAFRDASRRADVLGEAMRSLQRVLAAATASSFAAADDPLRLALPPVLPGGPAAAPAADVLAAWAALYLHAELDEAGVLAAVDALAEQRHTLALRDRGTADRLERYAREMREQLSRAERARIYARLFGLGGAATAQVRAAAIDGAWGTLDEPRLGFQQQLLRWATAIVRAEQERARLGVPGLGSQAAWRLAAQDLLSTLAALPAGSLLVWARRIHARTLQAFALLGDAGLMRQLGAQAPWQSLQRLLPSEGAAQRDAAARRGSAGQLLLRALPRAQGDAAPDAETVQAALRWLAASGLPVPVSGPVIGASVILSEAKDLCADKEARCAPRDPSPAAQDDTARTFVLAPSPAAQDDRVAAEHAP
jgi:hypothetical protein